MERSSQTLKGDEGYGFTGIKYLICGKEGECSSENVIGMHYYYQSVSFFTVVHPYISSVYLHLFGHLSGKFLKIEKNLRTWNCVIIMDTPHHDLLKFQRIIV